MRLRIGPPSYKPAIPEFDDARADPGRNQPRGRGVDRIRNTRVVKARSRGVNTDGVWVAAHEVRPVQSSSFLGRAAAHQETGFAPRLGGPGVFVLKS